jgi:hypothetical protein
MGQDNYLPQGTRPRRRGLNRRVSPPASLRGSRQPAIRTEEQKDRVEKFAAYVMVSGIVISLAGVATFAVTGRPQPAVRIITTAFWLFFASMNGNAFYTGRFRWKGGPTIDRRESPGTFYASAIFFAVTSMTMTTFLLWAAYFTK